VKRHNNLVLQPLKFVDLFHRPKKGDSITVFQKSLIFEKDKNNIYYENTLFLKNVQLFFAIIIFYNTLYTVSKKLNDLSE